MAAAIKTFSAGGTFTIYSVRGGSFSGEDAYKAGQHIGEHNAKKLIAFANTIADTPEKALGRIIINYEHSLPRLSKNVQGGRMTQAGTDQYRDMYAALKAGTVTLTSGEDYGVKLRTKQHITIGAVGQIAGMGSSYKNIGETTMGDLLETKFVRQQDGTHIDVDTGLASNILQLGGYIWVVSMMPDSH